MTNAATQYRQGDVFLIRVDRRPDNLEPVARDKGRIVLAYGEVTGHAHAIKAKKAALFRDPKLMAVFLHVSGDTPVMLEHEEHTGITLEPGDYEVRIQSEYHPDDVRQVED